MLAYFGGVGLPNLAASIATFGCRDSDVVRAPPIGPRHLPRIWNLHAQARDVAVIGIHDSNRHRAHGRNGITHGSHQETRLSVEIQFDAGPSRCPSFDHIHRAVVDTERREAGSPVRQDLLDLAGESQLGVQTGSVEAIARQAQTASRASSRTDPQPKPPGHQRW